MVDFIENIASSSLLVRMRLRVREEREVFFKKKKKEEDDYHEFF